MRRLIVLTVSLVTLAAGCRSACPKSAGDIASATTQWTKTTEVLLRDAGDRLGVPLQTKQMVHYAQWGASFYTAPAADFDNVPATALPRGVNVGVAYVDSPGQSYPKGYYSLRAFANPTGIGDTEGKLQLIDTAGKVAAEMPATYTIASINGNGSPIGGTDISVAAVRTANGLNGFHLTCYSNGSWHLCTQALVVPARLAN